MNDRTIRLADFDDPQLIEMISYHLQTARAQTAEGCAFALDLSGLRTPDIRLWTLWDGERLMGTGALKRMPPEHGGPFAGEVKSMHTHREARRKGVGQAILSHIMATARAEGMDRLWLETGSWDYFRPAVALYEANGFTRCGPYADYPDIESSLFMTKAL
jgi:putative acetyltransferase